MRRERATEVRRKIILGICVAKSRNVNRVEIVYPNWCITHQTIPAPGWCGWFETPYEQRAEI